MFVPIEIHYDVIDSIGSPEFTLLTLLLFSIGFPYFLLSSNATLIQRWYSDSLNESPYFLFSISNLGSMMGLLSYPLFFEWLFSTTEQLVYWGYGYIILISLIVLVFSLVKGMFKDGAERSGSLGKNISGSLASQVIVFAFIPSSLFLSTTLLVSTDIASFPFLWVLPLAIYLLSFIMVFSSKGERFIRVAQKYCIAAVIIMFINSALFLGDDFGPIMLVINIIISFLGLFVLAVAMHGQIALKKPSEEYITSYYFWMSVGGALGGFFNTIAPYLFNDVYEYFIILFIAFLCLPDKYAKGKEKSFKMPPKKNLAGIALLMVLALGIFLMPSHNTQTEEEVNQEVLFKERNFFGVVKVVSDKKKDIVEIYHGTTMHGFQFNEEDRKRDITTYYTPLDHLRKKLPEQFFDRPFGVIGLGAGTLACLGKQGQEIDMFEINPSVIDVALDASLFTYLRDCPAKTTIIEGDGRLKLHEIEDGKYNLFVIDAFNSDSIPMHLATLEAIKLYNDKISQTDGIIAFHISNRYLDLQYVLSEIAYKLDLKAYYLHFDPNEKNDTEADNANNESTMSESTWIMITSKDTPWDDVMTQIGAETVDVPENTPLWTDKYNNILSVMKFKKDK